MRRLILLNGPPGIGKSTLARRWAADRPGTLGCDIAQLRTMIGGWHEDFATAGAQIRPAALAFITAYLHESGDVVLPQFLADPVEVARFANAAATADAEFVHLLLKDSTESCVRRFAERDGDDPWHDQVRAIVAEQGGEAVIRTACARLDELAAGDPTITRVESTPGDAEGTYVRLCRLLEPVVLATERLVLRARRPEEASIQRRLWSERDPRVPPHRRLDADGHPTVEELAALIRTGPAPSRVGILAVEERSSGLVLGYCGLVLSERGASGEPEIAFELLRSAWGRGYATEAGHAVLDWARTSGFAQVWATVWDGNTASRRVLDKLGFTETGRTTIDPDRGTTLFTVRRL